MDHGRIAPVSAINQNSHQSLGGAGKQQVIVEWIKVKYLSIVWAQAQRPLNMPHARRISENLDPDMIGMLAVTLRNRDGMHHIIDGQHRKVAVEMLWGPNEKIQCEIYPVEDPERAAQMFYGINSGRKSVRTIDSFKIRVTAGFAQEVAVDKIVRENGLTLGSGDNGITCAQTLLWIYQIHGPETLNSTIKILQTIWEGDNHAFDGVLVKGFGEFMSRHGRRADWQRLKERIGNIFSPGRFKGATKSHKEVSGLPMHAAMKELIISQYNRGRSKGLLGTKENEDNTQ